MPKIRSIIAVLFPILVVILVTSCGGGSTEEKHRDPAQQSGPPEEVTFNSPQDLHSPPEEEYKSEYVKRKTTPKMLNWTNLNTALRMTAGESSSKKAILYFASKAPCTDCDKIEREVFTDERVLKNSERWVFVRINYDVEKELAEFYHIDSVPVFKALDTKGNAYRTYTGMVTAEQFANMLLTW